MDRGSCSVSSGDETEYTRHIITYRNTTVIYSSVGARKIDNCTNGVASKTLTPAFSLMFLLRIPSSDGICLRITDTVGDPRHQRSITAVG